MKGLLGGTRNIFLHVGREAKQLNEEASAGDETSRLGALLLISGCSDVRCKDFNQANRTEGLHITKYMNDKEYMLVNEK